MCFPCCRLSFNITRLVMVPFPFPDTNSPSKSHLYVWCWYSSLPQPPSSYIASRYDDVSTPPCNRLFTCVTFLCNTQARRSWEWRFCRCCLATLATPSTWGQGRRMHYLTLMQQSTWMIWWNGMVKGTWMAWCSGEVRDWKASCVCSCSVH